VSWGGGGPRVRGPFNEDEQRSNGSKGAEQRRRGLSDIDKKQWDPKIPPQTAHGLSDWKEREDITFGYKKNKREPRR